LLGDKISDKEVIKKILHSVPKHLEQVAISIETLLDLNLMSIEVATGHLRAVEERKKKTSDRAKEGSLLLMEEEWMVRLKVQEGEGSGGGCGGRGHGRGKHGGCGSGGGRGPPTDSSGEAPRRARPTDVYRACGKLSHWAKECRSKVKKSAQTHVVEEEKGGLLLAEGIEIHSHSSPPVAVAVAVLLPASVRRATVHPMEEKVFAQIGEEGGAADSS
jgi:hypothetical protein